ncbi:hypothetical protein QR680_018784 [Steinernema hermaphroditum]|uniref:Uncharacterized protein n=1 Tax=Steinernema hermaphroditum TaxID=289476 RepID=A0AA39HL57_9BILA|nr:hypothetical protein QR680_018784 [Steinernema hermaphroditum]
MRFVLVFFLLTIAVLANKQKTTADSSTTTTTEIPLKVFKIEEQQECQEACHDPCQPITGPTPMLICNNLHGESNEKSIFRPKTLTERVVLLTFVVFLLLFAVVFCGVALASIVCWTHIAGSRRTGIGHSHSYDVEKNMRL